MSIIVSTENVSFAYDTESIVRNISLSVPEQRIYGFVGPNGAGKSTTIKILLGLLTPKTGTVMIYGKEMRTHRTDILRSVGSLVETPSLYPHLTGGENLEIVRRVHRVPVSRIDRVLTDAGILQAKRKKVKEYSLGMKQRLGIALALLHSPRLLILDEPINGLDPEGIQEFRHFLRHLTAQEGITIFLSSHILAELEQVATHVGVIAGGSMKFQGTLEELQSQNSSSTVVSVSDVEKAIAVLRSMKIVAERLSERTLSISVNNPETAASVNAGLVRAGIDVYELRSEQPNLESLFLRLVQSGGAA